MNPRRLIEHAGFKAMGGFSAASIATPAQATYIDPLGFRQLPIPTLHTHTLRAHGSSAVNLEVHTGDKTTSSLARNAHTFAMSSGSVNRPSGTLNRNFFMFSSVYGTPTNCSNSPVPERSGHKALTRMPSLPNSAARPLLAYYFGREKR